MGAFDIVLEDMNKIEQSVLSIERAISSIAQQEKADRAEYEKKLKDAENNFIYGE